MPENLFNIQSNSTNYTNFQDQNDKKMFKIQN